MVSPSPAWGQGRRQPHGMSGGWLAGSLAERHGAHQHGAAHGHVIPDATPSTALGQQSTPADRPYNCFAGAKNPKDWNPCRNLLELFEGRIRRQTENSFLGGSIGPAASSVSSTGMIMSASAALRAPRSSRTFRGRPHRAASMRSRGRDGDSVSDTARGAAWGARRTARCRRRLP